MSSTMKLKMLCALSICMSLCFYFYWIYAGEVYSEYTMDLVGVNQSIRWFETPDWIHKFWIPIAIVIYLMIGMGWTIFKHILLLYIAVGILLGFSSESSCFTSLDFLFSDLWKISDGALLYLLYFESDFKKTD